MTIEKFSANFLALMEAQFVIIGAGVVGSAIAFELGRRGVNDIHVVDPDLGGTFSSSERNAGGVRHLWQQPINSELSKISIRLFESIATEIGFQQNGYLWLFSPERAAAGEHAYRHAAERGLSYEMLDIAAIQSRYPFIDKTDNLAFALLGARDGILNTNALKEFYRASAIRQGARFHDRLWVERIESKGRLVEISTRQVSEADVESLLTHPESSTKLRANDEMTFSSPHLVVAAGAWSDALLRPHLKAVATRPIRRQMSYFSAEGFDMSPYGMVVDTSGVYFHPEGGNLLGGLVLKDEKPGYRFDLDPDFFETHIWPNLFERSSRFERLKLLNGWGGLYSYTPDVTGIIGAVPGLPGVFEAHSFTGHGVMHSYGAAVLVAEKLLDGRYLSADGDILSRDRFDSGDLLPESFHI